MRILASLALILALATGAQAQDWTADRLRGTVEINAGGGWQQLVRGGAVLDGQSVRTGADGRVELVRDRERVSLEAGTLILLHEGEGKMTSIIQTSGALTADVERRNVQHFSVQAPMLAAIVKGTRFRVVVEAGASSVSVERGTVQVQDTVNDLVTNIVPGQAAEVTEAAPLVVSGAGQPAVFTFVGDRVINGTTNPAPEGPAVSAPAIGPGGPARRDGPTAAIPAPGPAGALPGSQPGAGRGPEGPNAGPGNNKGNGHSGPGPRPGPDAGPGPGPRPDNGNDGPGNGGPGPRPGDDNAGPGHGHDHDHGDDRDRPGPGPGPGKDNPNSGPGNNSGNSNPEPGEGNRDKGGRKDD